MSWTSWTLAPIYSSYLVVIPLLSCSRRLAECVLASHWALSTLSWQKIYTELFYYVHMRWQFRSPLSPADISLAKVILSSHHPVASE